jgi:hypothetical protein
MAGKLTPLHPHENKAKQESNSKENDRPIFLLAMGRCASKACCKAATEYDKGLDKDKGRRK